MSYTIEPISVVKVYVRDDDWKKYDELYKGLYPWRSQRTPPKLEREYVELFCGKWGLSPKSYEMALECGDSSEIVSLWVLKEKSGNDESLGIYGLVPVDKQRLEDLREKSIIEGYLELNENLHSFFHDPKPQSYPCRILTRWGSEISWEGDRENPKIVVTKGSGEIEEGWPIWFSDSALYQIRQTLSYC